MKLCKIYSFYNSGTAYIQLYLVITDELNSVILMYVIAI